MNNHDVEFKKTSLKIGAVLLIFIALFYTLFGTLYIVLRTFISVLSENGKISNILTELASGFIYCIVFIVPALIYMALSHRKAKPKAFKPLVRLGIGNTLSTVFASIAIITAAAYINSILASVFNISGSSVVSFNSKISLIEVIVYTLTLAVVPAFCEELLFRKTIMGALIPYGEKFAIVSSAILFGLMHQNILQIFYATAAGIVLGYAYSRTKSFLCVFLIHFTNNFISVIQQWVASNLEQTFSTILGTTITAAILVLGAISLISLMIKEKNAYSIYSSGCFERIDIPSSNYIKLGLNTSPTKRFFLSPTVLIFTIISILLSVLTIII